MIEFFIQALVTFFVVIDPIGTLAIFIGLTNGMSDGFRRRMAIKGTLIAWLVLTLFAFGGHQLLSTLGISLEAFRIAGGVFLFAIAFEMLFGQRTKRKNQDATEMHDPQDSLDDISVFPVAMPLLAGPGTITAVMLFASEHPVKQWEFGLMVTAFSLLILGCMGLFYYSNVLHRLLGDTFNHVLTRLLGMLLAALACQFVIDGVVSAGKNAYTYINQT